MGYELSKGLDVAYIMDLYQRIKKLDATTSTDADVRHLSASICAASSYAAGHMGIGCCTSSDRFSGMVATDGALYVILNKHPDTEEREHSQVTNPNVTTLLTNLASAKAYMRAVAAVLKWKVVLEVESHIDLSSVDSEHHLAYVRVKGAGGWERCAVHTAYHPAIAVMCGFLEILIEASSTNENISNIETSSLSTDYCQPKEMSARLEKT